MAEELDLEISAIGSRADGVGEHNGEPVFVPFTVTGDRVRVRVGEKGRTDLIEILKPGPDRAEPKCKHYGQCGGCALQHLSDNAYRDWTGRRATIALSNQGSHQGVLPEVSPEIPFVTPVGSRRRLALKALRTANGVILGFMARGSHRIIDVSECPVALPSLVALIGPMRAILVDLLPERGGATLTITETATGIDLLISGPEALQLEHREALAAFAEAHDLAAITYEEQGFTEPVAIRRTPQMRFADVMVDLPPGTFVQATAEAESVLVERVIGALPVDGAALDLFAGLGTFAFPLAARQTVHAVEGAKPSLDALGSAAKRSGLGTGVTTEHRDLFRRPLLPEELSVYSGLVFDPPRAGAKAQAAEIAKSEVPVVVAVSCNPNTFARDARLLIEGGYRIQSLTPVGQFLWSAHVELVAVFTRS